MRLLQGLQEVPEFGNGTVATIGNFDGVHKGHQALLKSLRIQADKMCLPLLVILFEPQPGEYFHKSKAPARLTSLREKLNQLDRFAIDYVYCLKFNKDLALMSPQTFAAQIIFSLFKVKYLLIGKDFRFGHNRCGDVDMLQNMAIQQGSFVNTFPDFSLLDERVSSTKVRGLLGSASLDKAAELLGRTYSICGRVIYGNGLGRQWGVPTANIHLQRLTLPMSGVFCVQVKRKDGTVLAGVANLGSRPTVDGVRNLLEVHLLNFNGYLYGEMLQVFFLHKLRDEFKFPSLDILFAQIHRDITVAKGYFKNLTIQLPIDT